MMRQSVIISILSVCIFAVFAEENSDEWFYPPQVVFRKYHPLSNYSAVCRRCGVRPEKDFHLEHDYEIEKESFGLYVPDVNDSNVPYGLIVNVQAGGKVKMPETYRRIFQKYKLIYVAVTETEDERKSTYRRRLPLALDGAYNIMEMYNIDPNRIYVAGGSVSGRVASITAFHYPDVFKGGIFVIGANCWRRVPVPGDRGKYWPKSMSKPDVEYLRMGQRDSRYVMLAGEKDFNRLEMRTYY
jgi:hypothetical protein